MFSARPQLLTRWRKRAPRLALTAVIGALFFIGPLASAAPEYEVKAAHLPKFAGYVQWPAGVRAAAMVIGIVGRDSSSGVIVQALSGAVVGGRRIEVRRIAPSDAAALRNCDIVFISAAEANSIEEILRSLKGRPVLTVGESDDFVVRGGMLQFILVDGQVRFVANPQAAARNGLQMESALLRVARRVVSE